MSDKLEREDYEDPACPFCVDKYQKEPPAKPIPVGRVIERLNEYFARNDAAAAERHLLYWLEEARQGRDERGELVVRNELVGHYRKTGEKDKALAQGEKALALLDALDFAGTVSAGTTYVNVATACSAFGENERALALFEKARATYESLPRTQRHLLGGLYNNMALVYKALGRYGEANELFEKAMDVMAEVPGGVLEQAITCLNMADVVAAEQGLEEGETRIFELLDQAYELLRDPSAPHDGYYAFVCEKCAPSFSYYGYFAAAEELQSEAKTIYERT